VKLIDTSCWIQALRARGKPEVRERVRNLVLNGQAAWCSAVRLELWAGVGKEPEGKVLRHYADVLPDYPITEVVWEESMLLAERGRRKGYRASANDVLIAACARFHGVAVEHDDRDFEWLMTI
jgi:predicted nucleic acid-binding protein